MTLVGFCYFWFALYHRTHSYSLNTRLILYREVADFVISDPEDLHLALIDKIIRNSTDLFA